MAGLPPDPRLDGAEPKYDPDSIVATITEHYQALSQLPFIDESDILYPPSGGWPNITEENFAPLGKTPEVIALLKRLPYLRNKNNEGKEYIIAFHTFVIDYSNPPYQVPLDEDTADGYSPDYYYGDDEKLPPWVIPLTRAEDNVWGVWLLLDTTDGTVTVWNNEPVDDYEEDDPRKWRNECQFTYANLKDSLDEWRLEALNLYHIAFWDKDGAPKLWQMDDEEDTEQVKEMQAIMGDHGWPNNFKKIECKLALAQWVEENR